MAPKTTPAQLIETHKEKAEIFDGESNCKERFRKLLEELSFPKGLLPFEQIEEMGYNKTSGFFWVKKKKKQQHKFEGIKGAAIYDTLITAFAEERRISKLTGVKGKELQFVVTISDIYIKNPTSGKVTFRNPAGLSIDYPASVFELKDEQGEKATTGNPKTKK